MQERFKKFTKEIVRSYFSGEIQEKSAEIIREEYYHKYGECHSSSEAMKRVADELGCSERTVRRNIYGQ